MVRSKLPYSMRSTIRLLRFREVLNYKPATGATKRPPWPTRTKYCSGQWERNFSTGSRCRAWTRFAALYGGMRSSTRRTPSEAAQRGDGPRAFVSTTDAHAWASIQRRGHPKLTPFTVAQFRSADDLRRYRSQVQQPNVERRLRLTFILPHDREYVGGDQVRVQRSGASGQYFIAQWYRSSPTSSRRSKYGAVQGSGSIPIGT